MNLVHSKFLPSVFWFLVVDWAIFEKSSFPLLFQLASFFKKIKIMSSEFYLNIATHILKVYIREYLVKEWNGNRNSKYERRKASIAMDS